MKKILLLLFIATSSLLTQAQKNKAGAKLSAFNATERPKNLSDTALLELVQKQTFRYFWDFGFHLRSAATIIAITPKPVPPVVTTSSP